jgi:hypothetical protein
MNATEISPKANPRLKRIRTVSRLVKWAIFALGSFSIIFVLFYSLTHTLSSKINIWHALFLISFQIVICLWYWKLTRLFHFYEQGLIFAAETIRCIKLLGVLWLAGWVFLTAAHFSPHPPTAQTTISGSNQVSPNEIPTRIHPTTVTVSHRFRVGFFTFDFGTGIDFGMPLGAVIIILVAWIMDEGRKIQEEQELTV